MVDLHHERSPVARARAERALVWLLSELDGSDVELTVLGGLVPETLVEPLAEDVPAHLGTADVDVLLITHVDDATSLAPVESALARMSFEPTDGEGWRWRGPVDGTTVLLEFLCDLEQYREGEAVRPPGCVRLAGKNLRGTGYVSLDAETRTLSAEAPDGRMLTVDASFAGFQGYLLSKCVAARTRGAVKDYYDLAYVLLHNGDGGPAGAAKALVTGPFESAVRTLRSTFLEIRERYRETADIGPRSYAAEMRRMSRSVSEAQLRADAVVGVQLFVERLLDSGDAARRA